MYSNHSCRCSSNYTSCVPRLRTAQRSRGFRRFEAFDQLSVFDLVFLPLSHLRDSILRSHRQTIRTIADLQSHLGGDLMKFKASSDELMSTAVEEVPKLGPTVVQMIESIGNMETSVAEALRKGMCKFRSSNPFDEFW